ELETIIAQKEEARQTASPAKIEMLLRNAHAQFRSEDYDSVKLAVESCVAKIEADPDGSFTLHLGIRLTGLGQVVPQVGSPGRV
ncbi:MAG: hypothetical protein ACOYIR_04300, partial [Christensenellales bacterium]